MTDATYGYRTSAAYSQQGVNQKNDIRTGSDPQTGKTVKTESGGFFSSVWKAVCSAFKWIKSLFVNDNKPIESRAVAVHPSPKDLPISAAKNKGLAEKAENLVPKSQTFADKTRMVKEKEQAKAEASFLDGFTSLFGSNEPAAPANSAETTSKPELKEQKQSQAEAESSFLDGFTSLFSSNETATTTATEPPSKVETRKEPKGKSARLEEDSKTSAEKARMLKNKVQAEAEANKNKGLFSKF